MIMARPVIRCAIYTRKSSEEGLDQEFNSLEAQREACSAFIKSQAGQGWRLIPERFDDGGQSGGSLERPALQRLLERVKGGQVAVIVLYKIDRLTRSLADFARLAELFDAHSVSFVSVTQAFNTSTSMGRLMLNVLLSFAQFEREVTGERIRDKIAASKQKGLWMGGLVPLGYDRMDRALVINPAEAETVRTLYGVYLELNCVRALQAEAARRGLCSKRRLGAEGKPSGGNLFSRGHLYRILSNPLYAGRIQHKGQEHPGAHAAIIDPETWAAVQAQLAQNRTGRRARPRATERGLLAGLLVDAQGNRFTPTHAVKSGRRYRYYVERALVTGGQSKASVRRIPAREIEAVVRDGLVRFLGTPQPLLDALGVNSSAADADDVLRTAAQLQQDLAAPSGQAILAALLQRVVLETEAVRLQLSRPQLRSALGLEAQGPGTTDLGVVEVRVPVRITTRSNGLKLILPHDRETTAREVDRALIKVIARAQAWWQRIESGQVREIRDLAAAESVTASYVSRVLRLAFLVPDLVEAIVTGRQPVELTAKRLLLGKNLPLGWAEQRNRLMLGGWR
jgi:site-specific DNA recombinase